MHIILVLSGYLVGNALGMWGATLQLQYDPSPEMQGWMYVISLILLIVGLFGFWLFHRNYISSTQCEMTADTGGAQSHPGDQPRSRLGGDPLFSKRV